jgi:type VI secretion system secreted protein Hcp
VAVDVFLKLDGIPGESVDRAHKGAIEVSSFGWGVSQTGAPAGGGGGGAGKAVFDELYAVARTSKASPKLFLACASGQHVKSAVLTCRRSGVGAVDFLRIVLTDVVVSSYELEAEEGVGPSDRIGLGFSRVEVEYVPVDAAGKLQAPVKAGWDLKKNAKV